MGDGLLAACDEALAQSTRLRWCAEDPGAPPRPWIQPPWLFEEAAQLATRKAVDNRLSLVQGEPLQRWGDRGYKSIVTIEGTRALFFVEHEGHDPAMHGTSLLRVTVPDTLERLALRIQGLHHSLGKALGLVREIEVGDAGFDARFLVTGAAPTAVVLTERVREALMALPDAHLRLTVGRGYATLTWTYPWRNVGRDALPPAALDVMAGIREAIAEG